jgi:hypothetical protein
MLAFLVSTALAGPSVPELAAKLDQFNAHAVYPLPALSDRQLAQLSEGEAVRILERPSGGDVRAIGLLVVEADQRDLWVAAQDPHYVATEGLTEWRMATGTQDGKATWYGHIDLPTPFKDRHWVVRVWNNHSLHAATGGTAWEHPWRLDEASLPGARSAAAAGRIQGITTELFDDSIVTERNQGAWIAVELDGPWALLAYHASTVVGGNIPDGLMARAVHARMRGMLNNIANRAKTVVKGHYTQGHEPLASGGPAPVPPYD